MMEVERANPSKKRREEEKGMRTREMGKRGWTTNEREEKLGVWNIRTTYFRSFFACFFLERGRGVDEFIFSYSVANRLRANWPTRRRRIICARGSENNEKKETNQNKKLL